MRILILTPEFDAFGGGIATYYRNLIPALSQRGHFVRLIEGSAFCAAEHAHVRQFNGAVIESLEKRNVERWLPRFSRYEAVPGVQRHLAASWAMWEQAGYGENFDIIEATDWGLLFAPAIAQCPSRLVIQCHGSIGQIAKHDDMVGLETEMALIQLLEKACLSAAGAVHTYSKANANFWRDVTGREVECILPPLALRSEVHTPREGQDGIVVGRLQRWKGPEVVCEALEELSHSIKVKWIGRDMPWRSRLQVASSYLGHRYPSVWGSAIQHSSTVLPEEVARLQRNALFNLVPSGWDVFNFTAAEAMASGVPLIISDGAGASQLVDDGVNGIQFERENAASLGAAIDAMLAMSRSEREMMGQSARLTVSEALNPDQICEKKHDSFSQTLRAGRNEISGGEWLRDFIRPQDGPTPRGAFLEQHSIRLLLGHAGARLRRKFDLLTKSQRAS